MAVEETGKEWQMSLLYFVSVKGREMVLVNEVFGVFSMYL